MSHCPTSSSPRGAVLAGLLTLSVLVGVGFTSKASAQQNLPLVKLQFEGTMPALLKTEVRERYTKRVKADRRKLVPLDDKQTIAQVKKSSPALAGCTTPDCIKRIGEITKSSLATSILVAGDAQIYDFEILFYDTKTGKVAVKKKGSCEICTATEAATAFGNIFATGLKNAKIKPVMKKAEPVAPPVSQTVSVTLTVDPPQASVMVDDIELGTGVVKTDLKPGKYPTSVAAQGYEPLAFELNVVAGEPINRSVTLKPTVSTGPVVTPGPEAPTEEPSMSASSGPLAGVDKPLLGWSLVGAGAVGVITGAVLISLDGETTCNSGPDSACPNVWDTAAGGATLVGLGAGAVGVGAIIALWDVLAAPGEPAPPSDATGFRFGVSSEGTPSVGWSTRF